MVIQVRTCDVGKRHEAIQRHLIIPNIALAAHMFTILLIIINFYRHCFVLVSGVSSHIKIVMILQIVFMMWIESKLPLVRDLPVCFWDRGRVFVWLLNLRLKFAVPIPNTIYRAKLTLNLRFKFAVPLLL
jgi:hypothetical protein